MSGTYKAIGINLKSMPLGESDRLLTILTREFGLIRAVAPGARKPKSTLGGRSGLFVVNDLLISKGRSLDRIIQAETLESYPRLSQDLGKLAASQYIAELVLCHALSEQPQEDLFCLLSEHLNRLETLPNIKGDRISGALILAHLSHCIFHFLALAGIPPQVQVCCLTQQPLNPDFNDPNWQVGFSVDAGGIVSLKALAELNEHHQQKLNPISPQFRRVNPGRKGVVAEKEITSYETHIYPQKTLKLNNKINAVELSLLQQLAQPVLSKNQNIGENIETRYLPDAEDNAWISVEQILRQYAQYHFDHSIRSAVLIDACF